MAHAVATLSPPSGPLPRYLQVAETLIRDVAAGKLADGERLPPEREMAAALGIAVGTLRQALHQLSAKGMLRRVQGSGNYIRAVADPDSVYALFRLELHGGGGLPSARVLSLDRLPKDPALPAFGSRTDALRIRRLRLLSGTPAAVEDIWLDAAQTGTLAAEDLSDALYLTYRTRLDLWIARAEDRVGQGALPAFAPSDFPYPPGTLLPQITRTAWSREGIAVEVSRTWYDPAVCAYVARLR